MMEVGKVKWFEDSIGYGFLEAEDGTEVFVHYSNIQMKGFRALRTGQTVTYEAEQGEKGVHAVNVTVQEETP